MGLFDVAGVIMQFFSFSPYISLLGVIFGGLIFILSAAGVLFLLKLKKNGEKGDLYIYGDTIYIRYAAVEHGNYKWFEKLLRSFVCVTFAVAVFGVVYLYVVNNADYFERAKVGDLYAQVYVADYYHELGDEDNSLYWFMVAANYNGKYGCLAKNNLAYLYWKKHKAEGNLEQYLPRIYCLLKESALGGNQIGEKNLYEFIFYYDFAYEVDANKQRDIFSMLVDKGYITDIEHYRDVVWEDPGIIIDSEMYSSDKYTRYTVRAATGGLDPNDHTKLKTYYTYSVMESNFKPDKMVLEYDLSISERGQ